MSTAPTTFVPPPVARWRRVTALIAAALAVLALAMAVWGTWNPSSLVVLHQHAADPVRGAFVTLVLITVANWLNAPVTSEAAQNRRLSVRISLVALTALTGLAASITGGPGLAAFRYEPEIIARSPDGQRAVALVTVPAGPQVHAFAGTGIGARDQGSFGTPCGQTVTARFLGADEFALTTDFGTIDLRLDPATGRPVGHLGPNCWG